MVYGMVWYMVWYGIAWCDMVYSHTYIHTHIHTYTHTYMHTYVHTYIHTYYIHIYIHIHIHTYIHTYILQTNTLQYILSHQYNLFLALFQFFCSADWWRTIIGLVSKPIPILGTIQVEEKLLSTVFQNDVNQSEETNV